MGKSGCVGYMKYSGELVAEGYLDARKSAHALLGFDKAIRYFVSQESSALVDNDFEFPVTIHHGSWEVAIPESIGQWLLTGAGVAGTTYLSAAAKKLAENDFKDASIKAVFIRALETMQWMVRIGKHVGSMYQKKFDKNLKWRNNNAEVGIMNNRDEYLYVPTSQLHAFASCPPKLFHGIADIIEEERELSIGVIKNSQPSIVTISYAEKHIFGTQTDDLDDILFPDLQHGQYVELEGRTTRGNATTNSVGFRYKDHILTCYPQKGSIVNYKHILFTNSIIKGVIDRNNKFGIAIDKRPKIKFAEIVSLENEVAEPPLL